MIDTTYQHWSPERKQERGLLNGERIKMARESRGMLRSQLARKLGILTKTLAEREEGWHFWTLTECNGLVFLLDYPVGFFTKDDPPVFPTPVFYCGTDADGETHCHVDREGEMT